MGREHTQSTRQSRHRQSQTQASQSNVEPEDEQEDRWVDEEDGGGNNHDDPKTIIERKARDLVRLALFNENKRFPLRRDEIVKKVIGSQTRAFNNVLTRAQEILRTTFGMDLVELPSLSAAEEAMNEQDAELLKNTGVKKKGSSAGTKSYILRSVLDPTIIQHACIPDPDVAAIEREDLPSDDDERNPASSLGSIIAWENSDEVASIGLLYVILALILVNGRIMRDSDLRTILKRLSLAPGASVPLSTRSAHHSLTIDTFLAQLVRQGYLDRQRVSGAKGARQKRGRAPAATQAPADDEVYEWRWGPRPMSEIGEKSIARFVAELMVQNPGEEEEWGGNLNAAEDAATKRRFEAVMKGIERAAAGAVLQELR